MMLLFHHLCWRAGGHQQSCKSQGKKSQTHLLSLFLSDSPQYVDGQIVAFSLLVGERRRIILYPTIPYGTWPSLGIIPAAQTFH